MHGDPPRVRDDRGRHDRLGAPRDERPGPQQRELDRHPRRPAHGAFEPAVLEWDVLDARSVELVRERPGRTRDPQRPLQPRDAVQQHPFGAATLADEDLSVDFSSVTTASDRVAVIATEPLTANEPWVPFAPGELRVFVDGVLAPRR